jgi:preprotein translocase SecE subunit
MATRTVKMSSEESQGGSRSELQKKVTGTVADTREFLHDVRVEMKQVTWPGRDDVVSTTAVVIATVAFFGIFLAIVERIAQWGLDRLLSYFHA